MKRKINIVLSLVVCTLSAAAQKLPNVQKESLRAPEGIKVDGKTAEWGNKFQAYNHATEVFYTISNDDDHLYLTLQATTPEIINKIIGGGITFAVQKTGKKTDKDAMSITYPIFDRKDRPYLRNGAGGGMRRIQVIAGGGGDVQVFKSGGDDKPVKIQGDSAMRANNKRLSDNSKYIGVNGIKDLDSLISVYNTDGIKTAEAFDTQMAYTYELSIDLKKLGLSANDGQKFAYHLTVNGSAPMMIRDVKIVGGGPAGGPPPPEVADMISKANLSLGGASSAPTDFWGEYTLAKK